MLKFLNQYEQRGDDEEEVSHGHNFPIQVKNEDDGTVKTVHVGYNHTIKHLRQKISQEFNISSLEFELSNDKYIYPEN